LRVKSDSPASSAFRPKQTHDAMLAGSLPPRSPTPWAWQYSSMTAPNAAYESESVIETTDYYPYGGIRIDIKTNYGGGKRKYAGTEFDASPALTTRWRAIDNLPEAGS
jgi:hypothetical protein